MPVLRVPFEDGIRELDPVDKGHEASVFVDPDQRDVTIEWEGRWRTLEPATHLDPNWENFSEVSRTLDLPKLLMNTGIIAGLGMAAP